MRLEASTKARSTKDLRPRNEPCPKRIVTGVVTRDKAAKTRRVEVTAWCGIRAMAKSSAAGRSAPLHDEENQSRTGDVVEIEEIAAPVADQAWKLLRVVARTQAGKAARAGGETTVGRRCDQASTSVQE